MPARSSWCAPRTFAPALLAGVLVALTLGAAPAGASTTRAAADEATPRTIDVEGTGAVSGTPDVLELVLGIEVRSKTATEGLARTNDLVRKVLAVLRDADVADDDVQTAQLSIWPVTNDDGTAVVGYSVSNTLRVTLRDLARAGGVVDAATEIAGDGIVVRGLSFGFDDNSKLVARARAEAVRQARAQADQLADAAGVTIGRLLTIEETSSPEPPVLRTADSDGSGAEAAAPIEPGTLDLAVRVRLRYEIT